MRKSKLVIVRNFLIGAILFFMLIGTTVSLLILLRQPKPPSKPYIDYIDSANKKRQLDEQKNLQQIIDEQKKGMITQAANDSNILIKITANKASIISNAHIIQQHGKSILELKKRQNEIIDVNKFSVSELQQYFSNLERHIP